MENYRVGTLEDRAYQAAVFFENITINSLREIILDVEISNSPKEQNMEATNKDTKAKHRRKQTFVTRISGEGVFIDDTVLQEDLEEKWVKTHLEWMMNWYNFSTNATIEC